MAQSILVFDFEKNEEAAQQARHKVEAWRQGFRLGNKMLLKFERTELAPNDVSDGSAEAKDGKAKPAAKKAAAKQEKAEQDEKSEKEETPTSIRLLVRLDFSDHEKLSHQRWLDRIPSEEPFKSAKSQALRAGDPEFSRTAELFESLD